MKRTMMTLLFGATIALPGAHVFADQALATSKNCMVCHTVDKKVLGPAFKEIAAKYATDKTATEKLVTKVIKGGGGVWGNAPMPANPQVNEADAKKLVGWILSLK